METSYVVYMLWLCPDVMIDGGFYSGLPIKKSFVREQKCVNLHLHIPSYIWIDMELHCIMHTSCKILRSVCGDGRRCIGPAMIYLGKAFKL
jgi:hypothetical protein